MIVGLYSELEYILGCLPALYGLFHNLSKLAKKVYKSCSSKNMFLLCVVWPVWVQLIVGFLFHQGCARDIVATSTRAQKIKYVSE